MQRAEGSSYVPADGTSDIHDDDPCEVQEVLRRWANREGEQREHVLLAVMRLADRIAEAPETWDLGDGFGGEVLGWLLDALTDRGLRTYSRHRYRPRPLVELIAARDGWGCAYCRCALGWGHPSVTPPEVEHDVPRVRGGTDDLGNLLLSCGPCNRAKHKMTGTEFRAVLR